LSRNEADKEYIRQDITYILQRIQEELLKGFLVVPLRDENGIWSAPIFSHPTTTRLEFGCPDGSYLTDNGCSTCTKLFVLLVFVYQRYYELSLSFSVTYSLQFTRIL